jgi:hypothetical protein
MFCGGYTRFQPAFIIDLPDPTCYGLASHLPGHFNFSDKFPAMSRLQIIEWDLNITY